MKNTLWKVWLHSSMHYKFCEFMGGGQVNLHSFPFRDIMESRRNLKTFYKLRFLSHKLHTTWSVANNYRIFRNTLLHLLFRFVAKHLDLYDIAVGWAQHLNDRLESKVWSHRDLFYCFPVLLFFPLYTHSTVLLHIFCLWHCCCLNGSRSAWRMIPKLLEHVFLSRQMPADWTSRYFDKWLSQQAICFRHFLLESMPTTVNEKNWFKKKVISISLTNFLVIKKCG